MNSLSRNRIVLAASGCAAMVALGLAAFTSTPVSAQTALGAGNRLDANPGIGTGRTNAPASRFDFGARNLLITGDVVGGRGFRGAVGYQAAGDFSAKLGSDDTYQFRARSAGTGIPFFDYGRSTEPLRMGQDLGLVEQYHRGAYTAPVAPTARPLSSQAITGADRYESRLPTNPLVTHPSSADAGPYADAQMRLDQALAASSIGTQTAIGSVPSFVGRVYTPDGKLLAADASSLRGLRYTPPEWLTGSYGLTTLDLVRSMDDAKTGRTDSVNLGRPYDDGGFEGLSAAQPRGAGDAIASQRPADQRVGAEPKPELKPEPRPGDQRVKPEPTEADHRAILERIAKRYANVTDYTLDLEPAVLKQLDKDFEQLRSHLSTGVQKGLDDDSTEPGLTPDDNDKRSGTRSTTPDRTTPGSTSGSTPGATGLSPGAATGAREKPDSMKTQIDRPSTSATGAPKSSKPESLKLTDPEELANPRISTVRERLEGIRRRTGERDPIVSVPSPIDVKDFGAILRHGEQVTRLSGEDQTRFNELLATGEEKMAARDYFIAERRFTRALRYTPGHPMALAGVVNAQLGAGLYLSSAFTFRSQAAHHPEMIDTYYGPRLLPTPEDMTKAIGELRKKVVDKYMKPQDQAASAMLLAYIGHQQHNRALVEEGLTKFRELSPEDPLLPLLETVWLGADASPGAAADNTAPGNAAPGHDAEDAGK